MSRTNAPDSTKVIWGRCLGETGKAIQFRLMRIDNIEFTPQVEWFPFSQVDKITRVLEGSSELDSMVVQKWILDKKEIEYE